jgi:hypothetical protein
MLRYPYIARPVHIYLITWNLDSTFVWAYNDEISSQYSNWSLHKMTQNHYDLEGIRTLATTLSCEPETLNTYKSATFDVKLTVIRGQNIYKIPSLRFCVATSWTASTQRCKSDSFKELAHQNPVAISSTVYIPVGRSAQHADKMYVHNAYKLLFITTIEQQSCPSDYTQHRDDVQGPQKIKPHAVKPLALKTTPCELRYDKKSKLSVSTRAVESESKSWRRKEFWVEVGVAVGNNVPTPCLTSI